MRLVRVAYSAAYRFGMAPWERYGRTAADTIAALLDREQADRPNPPGRALDLGCGRGQKTYELARRGWQAVGVDVVAHAVEAARHGAVPGTDFIVGDVTRLSPTTLGTFDFFLDAGCFQHLHESERLDMGRSVTALANPGATLLMLEFQSTRLRRLFGGTSLDEIEAAFRGWRVLSVEPASVEGLGWPLQITAPQWYRLRRDAPGP